MNVTCSRRVSLTETVSTILEGRPGSWGVYARHLGTGEIVAIDEHTERRTESSAKHFILVTYASLVAAGELDSDQRVAMSAGDRVLGSGVLRYLAPGLAPTLDDLAWLMVIVSDNVATNMLLREVGGPDAVNATMDRLGLPTARIRSAIGFSEPGEEFDLRFATSSARDLAESFAVIAEPERVGLDPAAAQRCRDILFRQQHDDRLSRRVPHLHHARDFDVEMPLRAYTKPGFSPGYSIDAGLFETAEARWVAAVMADGLPDVRSGPDDVGPTTCADIGESLCAAWSPGLP
jgi:beta-lactamase class A